MAHGHCVCVCVLGLGVWGGGGGEVVAGYLSILSMSQIETIPKLVMSCITHMIHIITVNAMSC